MNRAFFFNKIKTLGEFRCERDLRRFKNKALKNSRLDVNLYLGHFGHCKNGSYHHCEFELDPMPVVKITYYYRVSEIDGVKTRQRSPKPVTFANRGRRPKKK